MERQKEQSMNPENEAMTEEQQKESMEAPAGKNSLTAILLFLILLALVFQPWVEQLVRPPMATDWEYKLVSPDDGKFVRELNDLGEKGWELVFARRATSYLGGVSYECIFKRRK